jgi:hypothetical protein
MAVVDAEQVVEHQHLAVGGRPGADPDHGDLHPRHDQLGEVAGDGLEHDGEAAGLLERDRVVHHLEPALCGTAL